MATKNLQPKIQKPAPAATALYERLSKSINPVYTRLAAKTSASLRTAIADDAQIVAELRTSRTTAKLADADIEALLFIVLMEAAGDAGADLKAIMEDVRKAAEEKKALRGLLDEQQAVNARTIRGYKRPEAIAESEVSEMESLRLQMAMDRMTKIMSTLSNLLKKLSDTAEDIIRNLK